MASKVKPLVYIIHVYANSWTDEDRHSLILGATSSVNVQSFKRPLTTGYEHVINLFLKWGLISVQVILVYDRVCGREVRQSPRPAAGCFCCVHAQW